jgi:hypothetical protein
LILGLQRGIDLFWSDGIWIKAGLPECLNGYRNGTSINGVYEV